MTATPKIAAEVRAEVRRLRDEGLSHRQIQDRLGISLASVSRLLRPGLRDGWPLAGLEHEIADRFDGGATTAELARQYGVTEDGIYAARRRVGRTGPRSGPRSPLDVHREAILDRYLDGERGVEIARDLDLPVQAVWRLLKVTGISRGRRSYVDVPAMIWTYVRGSGVAETGARHGVGIATVSRTLSEHRIPTRPRGYTSPPRLGPSPAWAPAAWAGRDPELHQVPACPHWEEDCRGLAARMDLPAWCCDGCPLAPAGDEAPLPPPLPKAWKLCPRCRREVIPRGTSMCRVCAGPVVTVERGPGRAVQEAWRRQEVAA